MNGITLQALRSLLFFSVPEAARMIAGVQERTWRYWESERGAVPDDVRGTIMHLVKFRNRLTEESRAQIKQIISAHGLPDDIRLTYYSTLDDWMTQDGADPIFWRPHCSAMAEIALDPTIMLIKFDAIEYRRWLGDRSDDSAMRDQWAATLTK